MKPTSASAAALRRFLAGLAALAVASLALPSLAVAQLGWSVDVYGTADDGQTDIAQCHGDSNTGDLSVACGTSLGGATVSGSASAETRFGHLGVTTGSIGSASSKVAFANVHSNATASFSDVMQINNPNETGWGTLTFSLYLVRNASISAAVGDVGTQGAGAADIQAVFFSSYGNHNLSQTDGIVSRHSDAGIVVQTESWGMIDNAAVPSGAALGYHLFSIPFVFNQAFSFSLELRGHSYAQGSGEGASGSSFLEAMHSFDWAGIKQVSVDGRAVDYTLWSESGTDWNQSFAPVPEPETWALMLAGLAFLGFAGRHRLRREV